jgi:hypothetical protein
VRDPQSPEIFSGDFFLIPFFPEIFFFQPVFSGIFFFIHKLPDETPRATPAFQRQGLSMPSLPLEPPCTQEPLHAPPHPAI